MEPETLLFQTSPLGNIDAIVQHDGRCVYFFLNENPNSKAGKPKFGTRCVWVRNLVRGPLVFDQSNLEQGIPAVLPRTHTVRRNGLPQLAAESLRVVWFEEGNAAALIESDAADHVKNVLALIPPWSGRDGFHGYATECAAENEVCWPMPKNEMLQLRIANANNFWRSFESQLPPFAKLQPAQLNYYQNRFAESTKLEATDAPPQNYFSIDGNKFPPRGMVQIDRSDSTVLLTVGMALLPQPMVELATNEPSRFRRIELGLKIPREVATDLVVNEARKKISQLAAYPWSHLTWLGSGHSCSFSGVFQDREHAMLIDDALVRNDSSDGMPRFRDDPVNLLWLAPVSQRDIDQIGSNLISEAQARSLLTGG